MLRPHGKGGNTPPQTTPGGDTPWDRFSLLSTGTSHPYCQVRDRPRECRSSSAAPIGLLGATYTALLWCNTKRATEQTRYLELWSGMRYWPGLDLEIRGSALTEAILRTMPVSLRLTQKCCCLGSLCICECFHTACSLFWGILGLCGQDLYILKTSRGGWGPS